MKMKIFLLFITGAFCMVQVTAQRGETYPVRVGESPNKVIPAKVVYVLPDFTEGTAFLRDGTTSTQLFNYNILLDELQFKTFNGDTMAIADPVIIKNVVIDSFIFYYSKGYLREIVKAGDYKLAIKQNMVQVADKTRGAYDAASGASSITTYGSINNSSQIYRLQVNKDVLFQEIVSYRISDAYNNFIVADKKGFLALFDGKKDSVMKYIKMQHINFNKQADLVKLLQFCAAL